MNYINRSGNLVTVEVAEHELRALLGLVVEVATGPYAFDDEQWEAVMMQPRSIEGELMKGLSSVIRQFRADSE